MRHVSPEKVSRDELMDQIRQGVSLKPVEISSGGNQDTSRALEMETDEEDDSLDPEALKQILRSAPRMRKRTRRIFWRRDITREIRWNSRTFLGHKLHLLETISEWYQGDGWLVSEPVLI